MKQYLLDYLSQLDPIAYVFVLAMLPLFEARYAVVVASALNIKYGNIPWWEAITLGLIGNLVSVVPVMFLLPWANRIMHKWGWTGRLMDFFLNRARKRKDLIDRYGFWGLTVFVAIPLPVTGAWTGTLMGFVFDIPHRKTIVALLAGVLLATCVMTLASYGGIGLLSIFVPSI